MRDCGDHIAVTREFRELAGVGLSCFAAAMGEEQQRGLSCRHGEWRAAARVRVDTPCPRALIDRPEIALELLGGNRIGECRDVKVWRGWSAGGCRGIPDIDRQSAVVATRGDMLPAGRVDDRQGDPPDHELAGGTREFR